MNENKMTEDISDEMLKAYLAAADMETPDLWSRVEQGFEQELSEMNHRKNDNKIVSMDNINRKKRFAWRKYVGIAAAILICLIAVPVIALLGQNNRTKGDIEYSKDDDIMEDTQSELYQAAEESMEDSMAESVEASMDEESFDAEIAEFDSGADSDSYDADTVQVTTNGGTIAKNTSVLEVQVLIKEETDENGKIILTAEIQSVEKNEDYDVEAGDILEFDNAAYVEECAKADGTEQDDGQILAIILVSDVVKQTDGRYLCHYISGLE